MNGEPRNAATKELVPIYDMVPLPVGLVFVENAVVDWDDVWRVGVYGK